MLPYYLFIGMSAEEFWNGDPWLVKTYRKVHELKIQAKNEELWLQGLYFHDALGVVIGNAFGGKRAKKLKYLEKPIDIFAKTDDEIRQEEIKKQNQIIANLNAMKVNWDARQKRLQQQQN